MAYIKNVTDKQQSDIERAADHSAIRFAWFDGKAAQVGEMKSIRAYDLQAQGSAGSAVSSLKRQFSGSGLSLSQHNDKPAVFETPGKA